MDMGKEDRLLQFADLFDEIDIAIPPSVAHRNVRFRGATWERTTTDNYLDELLERGWLHRVDPGALAEGKLVEPPEHERAYYLITPKGRREYREAVERHRTDE